MRLTIRTGLATLGAVMVSTGSVFADQQSEVDALRARVAELEAAFARTQGDDWLSEQRADEIRSLVQDVLADADTRASLLQSGMTAGYDDGFFLGSSDGNFSLLINGGLQVRFIYNNQDNSPTDDNRWGFDNPATYLFFSGNVAGPNWGYMIETIFDDSGAHNLGDAWISYDFENGWGAYFGQCWAPLQRENIVHGLDQLAVIGSNVANAHPGGSIQGAWVDYRGEQFHFVAAVSDGLDNNNSPWSNYDTEFAFTARGEILFTGDWGQFTDFTSPRGSETAWMLGAALHWESDEYGENVFGTDESETFQLVGDISAEFDGANLMAAIVYTNMDFDVADDMESFGVVAQGGYYFTDDFEGFLRYEWNDFDTTGVDDLSILTLGVNKYFNDNVKWTTDLGFGFETVTNSAIITGWRDDTVDEDGQVVFRSQLQLVF